jgi:hypothetical protein
MPTRIRTELGVLLEEDEHGNRRVVEEESASDDR